MNDDSPDVEHDSSFEIWMIVAVIQEFRLDSVILALEQIPGFGGMTVSACRGFGREKLRRGNVENPDSVETTASAEQDVVDFTPKTRIEVAVSGRGTANAVIKTIVDTAHTGRRGDGKVFAWRLGRAVRVRTREEAENAF